MVMEFIHSILESLQISELGEGLILTIFIAGLVAGFIDTLAGGGGLITIPALMLTGMPTIMALGTNKVQAIVGAATSSFTMWKKKKFTFKEVFPLMLVAFIGSLIGTIVVQFIDADALSAAVPIVLVCVVFYVLLAPKPDEKDTEPKLSVKKYRLGVIPIIGFYDGILGPGTGSLLAASGVSCRGLDWRSATARAKAMNFATNLASVIVFLIYGKVVWGIGLIMILGQFIGAKAGAHCIYIVNPKYIRWLICLTSVSMLAKYVISLR